MKTAAVLFPGSAGTLEGTYALLETLNGLAKREEISLWVLGRGSLEEKDLKEAACARVVWADDPVLDQGEAEGYLNILTKLWRQQRPELVLFPGGFLGEETAIRMGLELGCSSVTRAEAIVSGEEGIRVRRAAYSMNLKVELELPGAQGVVAMTQGLSGKGDPDASPEIEYLPGPFVCVPPPWLSQVEDEPRQEEGGLRTAKRVVIGGHGMGSRENMECLSRLAELLDGSVGGSRPVIYDGWLPMDRMVGASAAILAPEKCLVFGASGAAAFAVGVEKSRFLAAVNSDPDARIFTLCDLGIVGDCLEVADALARVVTEEGGKSSG